MNFKMIAAAAALLAAGAANAAITSWNGGISAGNGSVVLLLADTTGTTTQGLTVDLGFNFLDFANNGTLAQGGTHVVWDFANNTITKNGVLVTGITNDWASQFAIFAQNSNASEVKWVVAGGSQAGTNVTGFLATGNPTTSQLNQQTSSLTANMGGVDGTNANTGLIQSLGNKGTITSADNGAYAMGATDTSYVGVDYNLTTVFGFKNNVKWNTWSAIGGTTGFTQVNADGTEARLGNATGLATLYFSGTSLVWDIPAVPESSSLALALAGIAGLVVARRRAAK